MLNRSARTFLVVFLTVCVGILFIVSPVGATSRSIAAGYQAAQAPLVSNSSAKAVTSGLLRQDPANAIAYWTPARMRSALSADKLLANAKFTHPSSQGGTPGFGAPAIPQGQQGGNTPDATLVPHSSYPTFPYSTVGKVFFKDSRTGLNYVCSGASTNSNNKSVVDTAGHCVVQGGSGGNWYTNWVFCPQYYNGSTPFGCWVARQLWSINIWVSTGSFEDDFGDAIVSPNSHGDIVNVVGGTGWAYNYSTSQNFTALGYPAASPFNGNLMYKCGPTFPSTVAGFDDGKVIAIPCNMTGGSSGGPWLISLNGTFGYVNGHNDFKYNSDPAHMYSPYYDGDWFIVFNSAQNH